VDHDELVNHVKRYFVEDKAIWDSEALDDLGPNQVHGHGSFFKHRNPALVDTKNAAAYGYRFDGKRRFNFD